MEITTTLTIAATLLALVPLAAVLWYMRAKRTLGAARRAIDESAGRLEFILRSSAIGVWSWDAQRDAVTADATCSQLFGFPAGHFPRDLAGFLGLVHPEDSVQVQAAVARAMELGSEYKLSFRTVWPDRRYLEDSLERELRRMTRKKHPAGLVMVDIDHFKRFNDGFGHEGGDAVLRAFGGFLTERLRTEDIACRYGGEEFCLVLGESSLEDTERRCEQLRSEVKQLLVQHAGKQLPPIAISVGIACFPTHGTTVTALISAADAALYRAKAGGRDRVEVAPVAETQSAE